MSRVKRGGANAKRISNLSYNPKRGVGKSAGTWWSRSYTQKVLSSKKKGSLTTKRISNPVLASGGKSRVPAYAAGGSIISTGPSALQVWGVAQTAARSLSLALSKGWKSNASKSRSTLHREACRIRERQIELFCSTSEYFGAPKQRSLDSDPHTTLDVLGMASGPLEPVGMAADLLNAFLYASEGDWGNAGISLGGFVPVAGTVAAGARLGKKAYNALDAADEAEAIARAAKEINIIADSGEAASVVGNKRLQLNQGSNGLESATRNSETIINNRLYSDHAIDRMQDRGIMPSVVEEAISHGKSRPDSKHSDRAQYYDKKNGIQVIVSLEGKVITVEYNSRGW